MRMRGVVLLGALVTGAVGCGDSVGPPDGEGVDLEFAVPEVRVAAVRPAGWSDQPTEEQRAMVERQALLDESGEEIPLPAFIFSTYVVPSFTTTDLQLSYGLFGVGTGYTISARADIIAGNGVTLQTIVGDEMSEDQPLYWYLRPSASPSFPTAAHCGARAAATGTFQVRSDLQIIGKPRVYKNTTFDQGFGEQAACPPGTTPLGTISSDGAGANITICYWTVWVDEEGNVVDVRFIGCVQVAADGNVT